MSRPSKELQDIIKEKEEELDELYSELLLTEIQENEAANQEDVEPMSGLTEVGGGCLLIECSSRESQEKGF